MKFQAVIRLLVTFVLVLSVRPVISADTGERIIGFSVKESAKQRAFEKQVFSLIQPTGNREILRRLASEPNMAGTPGDRRNAEFVRDFLEKNGLESKIVEFHVLLPYPIRVEATILGTPDIVIRPGESGVDIDPDTQNSGGYPAFNAFSPSGDVTGNVVFANFGRSEDYATLADMNVDIRRKIVLVRYGNLFRGSKVFEAEKRKAAAVILYSDPADDGYMRGDIYPKGPMRPADALQRGSILYIFNQAGDPLTPGEPALRHAKRLDPADAGLPKIPAMPISYGDAQKIFQRLDGPEVPDGWQGGLPLRYHVSGGLKVRVHVEMDYKIRPIWNTIGTLKGTVEPDHWVIVGCHRDSWVYGAHDPHTGNAVQMEMIRAVSAAAGTLGGLRRSILVATWDAEEFGVIGSVEWVELMRKELSAKTVAYMNADGMIGGSRFRASATPTLRPVFQQALAEVTGTGALSLLDEWRAGHIRSHQPAEAYPFGSFGGGSDHIGFLQHIGAPCLSAGFGGRGGVYHSSYDTFRFMDTFADPGFKSHAAGSRVMAAILTRLANAEVLPYTPSEWAQDLNQHFENAAESGNTILRDEMPGLRSMIAEIEKTGLNLESRIGSLLDLDQIPETLLEKLNNTLIRLERSFVDEQGLPGQPWNRNLLTATNRDNGYGAVTLPGLHKSLENPEQFRIELEKLKRALRLYRQNITEALDLVKHYLDRSGSFPNQPGGHPNNINRN